jgi:hypothetical protein
VLGLALLLAAPAVVTPPELFERGNHWRIGTPRGVVHVWQPESYDAATAGTVVYVHGYFASADTSWWEDGLARQFRESGRNALFIVPEAPASGDDEVAWPSLGVLLEDVAAETGAVRGPGPLVVVGHSGAFRTLEAWLGEGNAITDLVLLDAAYGPQSAFRSWARFGCSGRARLMVVAADTLARARLLVRGMRGVVRLGHVPASAAGFPASARRARVLLMRSQYEHHDIVRAGRVIPILLQLTPLRSVPLARHRSSGGRHAEERRRADRGIIDRYVGRRVGTA